ncbi:MAG: hypothetical protein ACN6RG_11570 [Stenotrophomonas sp.]|uniref:hypothetical protein n=1 Tax=unclassified Stenotrophomonas TaxID=196198 RepID=UPI001780DAAF|nr:MULTISPECIES: hypothetical protein [unclassified Stenotrophomonas]MBD9535604.1 hypothetical protein [Stenotrophomonas sp. STM01]
MRIRTCSMVLAMMLVPTVAMAKREVVDSGSGCLQNLAVSGGFTTGKQFLASTDHEGISYPEAFRKTVAAIEAEGLVGVSPNEQTGYIAAEQTVRGGGGSTVPLRTTVRRQNDGTIRVEVRFSIKGGQLTSNKAVGEGLCKIADAASL